MEEKYNYNYPILKNYHLHTHYLEKSSPLFQKRDNIKRFRSSASTRMQALLIKNFNKISRHVG